MDATSDTIGWTGEIEDFAQNNAVILAAIAVTGKLDKQKCGLSKGSIDFIAFVLAMFWVQNLTVRI